MDLVLSPEEESLEATACYLYTLWLVGDQDPEELTFLTYALRFNRMFRDIPQDRFMAILHKHFDSKGDADGVTAEVEVYSGIIADSPAVVPIILICLDYLIRTDKVENVQISLLRSIVEKTDINFQELIEQYVGTMQRMNGQ